ncbi:hypothetical protein ACQKGL_09140 [Ensifer adhaerens]|uniref:hypothetical protein n=1 Tax=Ensifer adhaerens TaxID=106592 RepID=UPI003D04B08B
MAVFLSCSQSRFADSPAKACFRLDDADGKLSVACAIAPASGCPRRIPEIIAFFQCFITVIDTALVVQDL